MTSTPAATKNVSQKLVVTDEAFSTDQLPRLVANYALVANPALVGLGTEHLQQWHRIGQDNGLSSDAEIAIFLLECFDKTRTFLKMTGGKMLCSTCHKPLSLICPTCGLSPSSSSSHTIEVSQVTMAQCSRINTIRCQDLPVLEDDKVAVDRTATPSIVDDGLSTNDSAVHGDRISSKAPRSQAQVLVELLPRSAIQPISNRVKLEPSHSLASSTYDAIYHAHIINKNSQVSSHDLEDEDSFACPVVFEDIKTEEQDLGSLSSNKGVASAACTYPNRTSQLSDVAYKRKRGRPRKNASDAPANKKKCVVLFEKKGAFNEGTAAGERISVNCGTAVVALEKLSLAGKRQRVTSQKRHSRRKSSSDTHLNKTSSSDTHLNKTASSETHLNKSELAVTSNLSKVGSTISTVKKKGMSVGPSLKPVKLEEGGKVLGWQCPVCSAHFPTLDDCSLHLRDHASTSQFACDICCSMFKNRIKLSRHRRRVHSGITYDCETCGKSLSSKFNLQVHVRIHSGDRPFQCLECGKGFRLKTLLDYHSDKEHRKTSFSCEICGATFITKRNLKSHMLVHTNIREFLCEDCGQGFKQKVALLEHVKVIHLNIRDFPCPLCDNKFATKIQLESHLKSSLHYNHRDHVCSVCGMAFSTKSGLKVHFMLHSGEKPWQCDSCEKAFRRKHMLLIHQRVHTGTRPALCDVCGRGFQTRGNMRKHRDAVHKNAPPLPIHPSHQGKNVPVKPKFDPEATSKQNDEIVELKN